MKIDTQGMSFGDGKSGRTLEEQRAAIKPMQVNKLNIISDSLKIELKDLINEGFEVKSYAISDIEVVNDLTIILFVTVLQKDNEVYECQEYQTIDKNVETLDMNLICKELVQPYERGIGT